MNLNFKSKKGTIFDALGLIIIPIFLIVFIIAGFIAYSELDDSLESFAETTDIVGFNESRQVITDQTSRYAPFQDFSFIFFMFGTWISMMIAAFILGNNSAFLVIYVIMSFALIISGILLEFILQTFINDNFIFPFSSQFPMMVWMVDHFLTFALFFTITIGMALYMKPSSRK